MAVGQDYRVDGEWLTDPDDNTIKWLDHQGVTYYAQWYVEGSSYGYKIGTKGGDNFKDVGRLLDLNQAKHGIYRYANKVAVAAINKRSKRKSHSKKEIEDKNKKVAEDILGKD